MIGHDHVNCLISFNDIYFSKIHIYDIYIFVRFNFIFDIYFEMYFYDI